MPARIATSLPFKELEVASGNYDTSRSPIDRIVIHTMVGTVTGAAARFDTYGTQVSAHYGIGLDGNLYHWLEETYTAYHAGNYLMNQRSIGIEHEDGGDYNGARPDTLYNESAKLVADICKFYNIPCDRTHILKHNEIIPTGCPDALDIDRIVRQAQAILTPPLALPNPGYAPTFAGQDVTKDGIHYHSNDSKVWVIIPPTSKSPSSSPSASKSPSASASPSAPADPMELIKEIVDGKWTWLGKTGWKNNLAKLRNIL